MRRSFAVLAAAAALATFAVPGSAHATPGAVVAEFKLHAATNEHASQVLPAGAYLIEATGTYVHDTALNPPLLADAECTEGGDSRGRADYWRDPLDEVAAVADARGVVSTWHPFRYVLNGRPSPDYPGEIFYTGNVLDDPFDIYVNTRPQTWVPVLPTVLDSNNAVTLGCNAIDHHYATTVLSDGVNPTVLNVYDLNYADDADVNNPGAGNGPGITIRITELV
jgi:hypothetical protein